MSDSGNLNNAVVAFYGHLSAGRFDECFRMLDPQVTEQPMGQDLAHYTDTLSVYARTLPLPLRVERIDMDLGRAPSRLYGDRDFAYGTTTVRDAAGRTRTFRERWVLVNGLWCSRCVGYFVDSEKTD